MARAVADRDGDHRSASFEEVSGIRPHLPRSGHVGHIAVHAGCEPAVKPSQGLCGSGTCDTNEIEAELEGVCFEIDGQLIHEMSIADTVRARSDREIKLKL